MVAANAPDVDVLSFARGEYYALAFRRGLTHGWPALLVLPFIVAGAVLAWDRWVRRRRDPTRPPARPGPILALSALGLLTHPSLDWLNTYGMRWGLPFDGRWSYGDALFIIDPWIWLTLGGALFLASDPGRRARLGWTTLAVLTTALVVLGMGGWPAVVWCLVVVGLVGAGLRGRPRVEPSRAPRIATVAVALYIVAMIGSDLAARRDVRAAAEAAGLATRDVMVAPVRGNPFHADVEVLTDRGFVPGTHDWLRSPRVRLTPEGLVPLLDAGDLDTTLSRQIVDAARARPVVAHYLTWSRYPYVVVSPDAGGWRVRVSDARYDSTPEAGGLAGVSVVVTPAELP